MVEDIQYKQPERPPDNAGGSSVPAPLSDDLDMSPVPGMDMASFKNYLTRALGGDGSVPPVILELVNAAQRSGVESPEERDQHWWREFFWQRALDESFKALDRLIARYNEMADWHHGEAEKARARMREATDKLAAIEEFVTGVDDVLRTKEHGGKFDREKAIRLLKARGIEVDPNEDENTLENRLAKEKIKAQAEKTKWSKQYDRSKDDADLHDRLGRENHEKAKELVAQRDELRRHGSDPQTISRLEPFIAKADLDVKLKAADIEQQQKNLAQQDALEAATQQGFDGSQSKNEEADFLASANNLRATFKGAHDNVVKDSADTSPANRNATPASAPAGP